jgi:hypothetical protein
VFFVAAVSNISVYGMMATKTKRQRNDVQASTSTPPTTAAVLTALVPQVYSVMAGRLAEDTHLAVREDSDGAADPIASALLSRTSSLAEVVIPSRSKLIGQTVFPGMVTEDGEMMVLAIQRGANDMPQEPTVLAAGDHLLLQGTWKGLDRYLADPKVLVVDSPEVLQKQAVALGHGARRAIAILLLLIVLLSFNIVAAPIAAVICAALMVITRVREAPASSASSSP